MDGGANMQFNQEELKKVLDQGLVTRSVIENEVAMKKCFLYSEMAQDKETKAFFKHQGDALEGVIEYFKKKHGEVM